MESATKDKQPASWQLESWKEALRWFFRAAKGAATDEVIGEASVWLPAEKRWRS